jgi:hypothetical protein
VGTYFGNSLSLGGRANKIWEHQLGALVGTFIETMMNKNPKAPYSQPKKASSEKEIHPQTKVKGI